MVMHWSFQGLLCWERPSVPQNQACPGTQTTLLKPPLGLVTFSLFTPSLYRQCSRQRRDGQLLPCARRWLTPALATLQASLLNPSRAQEIPTSASSDSLGLFILCLSCTGYLKSDCSIFMFIYVWNYYLNAVRFSNSQMHKCNQQMYTSSFLSASLSS